MNVFRITTEFSAYSEVTFPNHVNPLGFPVEGCKVQLVDNNKSCTFCTDCYSPRVDLPLNDVDITVLLRILSVARIVTSFFKNQRKQFTHRLTNSINNNINFHKLLSMKRER